MKKWFRVATEGATTDGRAFGSSWQGLEPVEAEILSLINRSLPDTAILCVSHRDPFPLAPYSIWQIGLPHQDQTQQRNTA